MARTDPHHVQSIRLNLDLYAALLQASIEDKRDFNNEVEFVLEELMKKRYGDIAGMAAQLPELRAKKALVAA